MKCCYDYCLCMVGDDRKNGISVPIIHCYFKILFSFYFSIYLFLLYTL